MKMKDAVALFLGRYKNIHTKENYRGHLHRMMGWIGPERPVAHVTPADMLLYFQNLEGVDGQPLSEWSMYAHIKTARTFFNFLVSIDEMEKNPARAVPNRRPRIIENEHRAATERETQLVEKAIWSKPRSRAMLGLIIDTGCTAQGVATLTFDRLYLPSQSAIIVEKTRRYRVHFTDWTAEGIEDYLAIRPEADHAEVFLSVIKPYGPMTNNAVRMVLSRIARGVLTRHLGTHAFRHKIGFDLAEEVPITVVADVLGHVDPKTTWEYYAPKSPERAERAIKARNRKRGKTIKGR